MAYNAPRDNKRITRYSTRRLMPSYLHPQEPVLRDRVGRDGHALEVLPPPPPAAGGRRCLRFWLGRVRLGISGEWRWSSAVGSAGAHSRAQAQTWSESTAITSVGLSVAASMACVRAARGMRGRARARAQSTQHRRDDQGETERRALRVRPLQPQ